MRTDRRCSIYQTKVSTIPSCLSGAALLLGLNKGRSHALLCAVDAPREFFAADVTRPGAGLTDLGSILALAGVGTAAEPSQIVSTLGDALLGMLHLSFVFVRLRDLEGSPSIETMRIDDSGGGADRAREIREAIQPWLSDGSATSLSRATVFASEVNLSIACGHLGLDAEFGVIVAGSQRRDFPGDTERLVLDAAANQATIGLQRAYLSEQRRELAIVKEALRESEDHSRQFVHTVPGLAAILTPAGEVEVVNDELVEYCGQPLEAMKQWGTNGTVHRDDVARVGQVFTQAIASGTPYDFEARIRRFDGVYHWCQVRGLPFRDRRGHILRWYVLLSDIDDRKRAENALRESERESRLIVDSIPGLVAVFTPDGELEFVNRPIVEYFGHTLEELKHWGAGGTTHPEDLPRVVELFARSIASGDPFEIELRARRFDGAYRWFQSRGLPHRDTNGRIVRWYNLLIDVDERKRAEQELRRSAAFLAQGQRLTLTGSLWWDVATGEIIWSDETFRLMEVPTSVKPSLELALERVHPDDLPLVREMVDRSAREGVNMDFEPRLRMPDESVKHVHVVLQNVGQSGRPEFVGAVTDITERKRAEAELRRAYDHLTEAQRLSQTGSFTADLARDEHFWSDEFYRICEFEPGSAVTIHRLGEIVHPDDVALYEGAIGRAMAGTDPDFYFRIVTSRGVVKHLRGFAHRIADRPVFVGAVQDVTASKMAQEALNKAGAELAHVSRMTSLSALTASIAHEVNQPLSGILTNAGTCLRMLDAAPPDIAGARETARRTIRDGHRASDVIARLRMLFSKREFTLEPVDLNEATREVIALSSNELQRNRVILQSELAEGLPAITGDRIQLQQVVLNLLRNAADAMADVHERPRHLLIKTEVENGPRVRLTVRDAGVGLTPESLDSMFDAFYTTKSGGMGIGLFVSRSIVERHQGRLWAEPNDGPGATFALSVPVVHTADPVLPLAKQ